MSYALISLYKNLSQGENPETRSPLTERPSHLSPAGVRPLRDASLRLQSEPFLNSRKDPRKDRGFNSLQGEVTAMAVSPFTLYCYWEIFTAISARHILTIYNMTENISWEIKIDQQIGSIYIGIRERKGDGPSDFQVAIGIKIQTDETFTERLIPISISNIVSIPSATFSNRLDQEWWSPEDESLHMELEYYEEIASRCLLGKDLSSDVVASSFCLARK